MISVASGPPVIARAPCPVRSLVDLAAILRSTGREGVVSALSPASSPARTQRVGPIRATRLVEHPDQVAARPEIPGSALTVVQKLIAPWCGPSRAR
jgi:hypothetical protein